MFYLINLWYASCDIVKSAFQLTCQRRSSVFEAGGLDVRARRHRETSTARAPATDRSCKGTKIRR